MSAIVARICFVLLLFAAAPAQAIVCTVYDQPLTQEQVERYAAEAKDGYPAKYRAMLDTVKITLTDSLEHNLTMIAGSRGNELIVPAGYLKANCVLAMGASMFDDYAKEMIAKGKPVDFTLPECPGLGPRECMFRELDKSLRRAPAEENGPQIAEMFRLMIESAFRFAIAHEYGHVIADADRDAGTGRRPADYDAELAADMLALHTVATGQVIPLADTFLFGGQVLFEALGDGDAGGIGPHEATVCRARRSNAMRQRLIPPLLAVLGWTRSDNASVEALPRAAKALAADFAFVPTKVKCALKLPAEVAVIEQDLKRLGAAVSGLPRPTQLDEAQLAAIQRVKVNSRIGGSLRNAIYGTVSVVRVARLGGVLTGQGVDAQERTRLLGELERIDRLPTLMDMSSREYRDFLYTRAIGRYASGPPGSRFSDQVVALRQEIDRANAYGQPHMVMGLFDAISLFFVGDCERGMATLLQAYALRETMLARTQLAIQMMAVRIDPFPSEFNDMIAYGLALRAGNKPMPEETCRAMRGNMAEKMRATYGWVD